MAILSKSGECCGFCQNTFESGILLEVNFAIFCLSLSAAFITGLLNNIGTHVDPILLIHRIKEGMEIPNLRDSLVKILQDYNLQVASLFSVCLSDIHPQSNCRTFLSLNVLIR